MRNILNSSYREEIYSLEKIESLASLTLIGKPLEKRELKKIIDVDILIILNDPMTVEKYDKIKEITEKICKKYTTAEIDVLYAIADGPMKPKSFKKQEIFFHIILHTLSSYKLMPLLLCKNSWQQFEPLKGKAVKEIQSFEGVSKDMLLNSTLGISSLIELVEKDSSGYIGWEKQKNSRIMKWKLFPLKFEYPEEKADLYIYAVLRCASNAIRYLTRDNTVDIGFEMAELFKEMFANLKNKNLPAELLKHKHLLRNKIYSKDIHELKSKTLEFLNELKEYIENT